MSTEQKTNKLNETKSSYLVKQIKNGMKKHITIDGHEMVALIDTVSEI